MPDGKVIPFIKPGHCPPEVTGAPELARDPATGLYSIVVDGVAVYEGLDPVGRREAIYAEATDE